MKLPLVAFDVDGTLITEIGDVPRPQIIAILDALYASGRVNIMVWSGGGKKYAEMWGLRLGLPDGVEYAAKDPKINPDVAFDDAPEFKLGKVQIIV